VHETEDEVRELQRLLDESYERAGAHLHRIFTEEKRIPAAELANELRGVQVLNLATVTPSGAPRVAPVDGLFFKGRFWFGSAPDSTRFRNIRERPDVSGSVTRGEEFAVIVHGTAHEVEDKDAPEVQPFKDYLLDVYEGNWDPWSGGATYARIEPTHMFTFRFAGSS
jgi:uncharacterized pyridoxamine 5'-phosphate oxidase family protein